MKIDGGCHCGHITYEAEIDADKVSICHCTDCQTLSGTAFRVSARIPDADFKLLTGTPKSYIKTAASGNKRAQMFCPECGTSIYANSPDGGPGEMSLRLGTIRQRAQLKPTRQIWHGSAQAWVNDLADIPVVGNP
jgi:hypothetical protein